MFGFGRVRRGPTGGAELPCVGIVFGRVRRGPTVGRDPTFFAAAALTACIGLARGVKIAHVFDRYLETQDES